ncbi:MAG: AgmX/PglI C-terminal domain-containing protein [Myxococcota bacterium]
MSSLLLFALGLALGQTSLPAVRGRVTIKVRDVGAGLDSAQVEAFFTSRKAQLAHCYEKELRRNPEVSGFLGYRATVSDGGRLEDLTVESDTVLNDAVASCLKTTLVGWKLPQPKAPAGLRFELAFSSLTPAPKWAVDAGLEPIR